MKLPTAQSYSDAKAACLAETITVAGKEVTADIFDASRKRLRAAEPIVQTLGGWAILFCLNCSIEE